MDDQHAAVWAGTMLRRPAVDPGVPRSDRVLLTAPGALLTLACRDRPARIHDFLPSDPAKREMTIDAVVIGMRGTGPGGAPPEND